MGLTNFPHGITSFGIPQLGGGGLVPVTSGSYFWVDSNASSGGDGTYEFPYNALSTAYAACTTSKGDVIIMKPGHAETISAATGIVFAKIGVTVVGLGNGSNRPTFTLTGTAATCTMNVTGASNTFRNFIVTNGVDELTSAWTIGAAYCTLDGVDLLETSASYQMKCGLTTVAAGDNLTVKNCRFLQITVATGNGAAITLVGADDAVIVNNSISWLGTDHAASGGIIGLTTASLRVFIVGNYISTQGGTSCLGIGMYSGTTGVLAYNGVSCTNGAGSIVGATAMATIQNFSGTTGTTSAILDPAAGV